MNTMYALATIYAVIACVWAGFIGRANKREGRKASSLALVLLGLVWPVTVPLTFAMALYQIHRLKRAVREINKMLAKASEGAWLDIGTVSEAEARADYQKRKLMGQVPGVDLPKTAQPDDAGWFASDVENYLKGREDAIKEAWEDVSGDSSEIDKFWHDK